MVITIKLMPDYDCWPLWWHAGTEKIGNIDPASLGISSDLVDRLNAWAAQYDAFLNRDDPTQSGPATPEIEDAFENEGFALLDLLRRELSGKYHVIYYSTKLNRLLSI
jgi:hypothetical protein